MNSIKLRIHNFVKSHFFKFLLIGGFCTLQNIIWLYVLTTILGLHYLISTTILAIVVNSLGFYLNRRFAFKKRGKENFLYELWKYHTVMLSSFLIVLVSMYILVDIFHIWYLLANIIITICMVLYNFLMHKKWTFK
jgi:putative flippase GtrA